MYTFINLMYQKQIKKYPSNFAKFESITVTKTIEAISKKKNLLMHQ